jgi:predicted phosphodiesterase
MIGRAPVEARRVAVIADVHGNVAALRSAWRSIRGIEPDLLVSCGDLTWGSLPHETLLLIHEIRNELPCLFVRGNAERALAEMADELRRSGSIEDRTDRDRWMLAAHTDDDLDFVRGFEPTVVVDVADIGSVRFCHGSPAHDEDCITPITPEERLRPMLVGVDEETIVSGHIHVQFERHVGTIRSINPGSVGLPYQGQPGAFWAFLAEGNVTFMRSEYDRDEAYGLYRRTTDPLVEKIIEMMVHPTTADEMVEYAESLGRAG